MKRLLRPLGPLSPLHPRRFTGYRVYFHVSPASCKFAAMRFRLIFILLAVTCGFAAMPPEGIPRELARERASRISDVRYQLQFTLVPHAPSVAGHEGLRFYMNFAGAVL